jgi:hypothetical protein
LAQTIKIHGLKDVQKKLRQLGEEFEKRVIYRALRRGAALVKRQAQANAPRKTSALKNRGFIVFRPEKNKPPKGVLRISLGIASSKKDDPYYGRFQELGWNTRGKPNQLRYVKGAGRFTRRALNSSRATQHGRTDVPGKFFLDKAFKSKKAMAIRLIERNAKRGAEILAREKGL